MRLRSEHHEIILNFAELFPQIITNRFIGLNARQENNQRWQTLANHLNALGFGNLSVPEYKRVSKITVNETFLKHTCSIC